MSTVVTIIDKWGKKRQAQEIECANCHKKVIARLYTNRPNLFCSVQCSAVHRQKRALIPCDGCGKSFEQRISRIKARNFCSRKCKDKDSRGSGHPRWKDGLATYRDRAIREYGYHCKSGELCPLKDVELPEYMYDADHINSDRTNNDLSNLQILCAWCHRKKTWGYS